MTGGGDKEKNKGEGSGAGIDHNSLFYLHPSDVLKQLHVNEVLSDSNFADWSQEMENFLFAKNKFEFVDGTLAKPEKGTAEYMSWMRCDAMVKGWLTTAMEKGIRDSVKYATTAAVMWLDLHERFGKESSPRAFELKQKIAATWQDGAMVNIWKFRFEQYVVLRDYRMWESIKNGPAKIQVTLDDGSKMDKAENAYTDANRARVSIDKQSYATLTMALAPKVLSSFRDFEDAKSLWNALARVYEGNHEMRESRKDQLRQQFSAFNYNVGESLDELISRYTGVGSRNLNPTIT